MVGMARPEIRKDYFKDEFVVIATNRAKRPHKIDVKPEPPAICPFCPDNFKGNVITYQDNNYYGDWEVVAFLNKFPALTTDFPDAYGQCEVIVETRQHRMDINDFSIDHIVRVFNAYIDRFDALRNMDGIKHVLVFKNEGAKSGNSLEHTHSQVIALPILPPQVKADVTAYNQYRLERVTCPYCDIIKKESGKTRLAWEDENVFVLCPWASRSPYEAWLLPKRHVRFLSDLTRAEKESLAYGLKLLLDKLDDFGIPYNYFIENAVNREDHHMFLKLTPRPNVWGGLEMGTGVIINPISPEMACKFYRAEADIKNTSNF